MNDPTFQYRLAAGLFIFTCMAAWDIYKNGRDARRWREYTFLFSAAIAAMGYGILHDYITWSISPGYFQYGKKLGAQAEQFGWPMIKLAMSATWTVGLVTGAAFLIANNADRQGRQLPFRRLWPYGLWPLCASIACEMLGGAAFWLARDNIIQWMTQGIHVPVFSPDIMLVWGMHLGAYIGAVIGAVAGVALILLHKRKLPIHSTE